MAAQLEYRAIVTDIDDPDQRGRIRARCAEIYGTGDEEIPAWIEAEVQGGAAPGAGWWFVPPVDAVVVLRRLPSGDLRWRPGPWGSLNAPPSTLAGNYPRRSGWTSPDGVHTLALDDDSGMIALIADPADPDGIAGYLTVSHLEARIGTSTGSVLVVGDAISAVHASGSTLALGNDGILLLSLSGSDYLQVGDGVVQLAGGDLQITGGAVTVTGMGGVTLRSDVTGVLPVEPVILGTSFLTGLSAALTEIVAAMALIPAPSPNTAAFLANVNTAIGAGAPYLSTVTQTE